MIIKNNEHRASITPKTQTSLNSPVRRQQLNEFFNTQTGFITSAKQLTSIKEISPKQQELNRLLNQKIELQVHSANTSMHSLDCLSAHSKLRKKFTIADMSSKLMQIDDEILEVYNEFEKNYKSVNNLEKMEMPQYQHSSYLEVKRKDNNNLLETYDGLKQSDLKQGNENRIKITRFKFFYFRIKLRGKISPIQVLFNVPERVQSSSLKLFLSTKAEFPTKFNAEYILYSRYAKIFSERNQHYFTEEYLFITMYSEVDFEFSISFQFGNNPISKSPPKQVTDFPDQIMHHRQLIQKPLPKDKIIQNLELSQYHSSQKLRKFLSIQVQQFKIIKSERTQKHKLAKSLRQSMNEDKYFDKMSKLLVKDQIIQFREVEKQMLHKKALVQFAQKNWFQIFSLLLITEYVQNCLYKIYHNLISQEAKRKQKVAAKGKLIVWAMKTKALIDVKEYGDSAKERTISKTRCIIYSFANIIRDKTKLKAEFVVTKFMDRILLFLTILNKHQSTLNKVMFIQRKFRYMKAKKRQFRDKFWKLIKENISEILFELKRTKDTQYFVEKQQVIIDVPVMNTIIDEYNKKQRALWMQYIQHTYLEKDQKRKIHETALNLKEPKIYDLPNKMELVPLIEQYAKMKKIL